MADKVLLISRGTAFLTNALVASLKIAGITAEQAGYEIEQVKKYEQDTDLFLFFVGNEDFLPTPLLQHLRDLCADGTKDFCVLGYSKEITEIEEIIPKEMIRREFLRPIDVKTITEQLCALLHSPEPKVHGKSILLVDDDAAFLRILQGWLSEQYEVTSVKSGMQALTCIGSHLPDLVLLDYDMPITNGPQVLEMIRSEPYSAQLPVLFLTGKNDRDSVMTAMTHKPDGYLLKTSGKDSILSAVHDIFAKTS
ncbi:MAG: response regulator [Ruminococcaceae bacterium]|nr:response regulator [Oscillospiraceae bacterium]